MTGISALGFWSPKKFYPEKSSVCVLTQITVLGGSDFRPLIAEQPPRDTECVPGGRAGCLQGTESTEETPECKKSSKGKSGQTQAQPEEENAGSRARFCVLSIEAFSQGSRFSAWWSRVTLLGSRGFAATCLGQASPVAFAFRLAPKLASRRIVFILFLQLQLLPDSFQSVTSQLSVSEPRRASPSWPPACSRASGTLSAWAVATCQTGEPSCGLDAAPRALCNLIITACSSLLSLPAPRASAPRSSLLKGRYWDSVTCREHGGQTKEVSWSCKSSCPRGSELAPSQFCLFFFKDFFFFFGCRPFLKSIEFITILHLLYVLVF